MGTQDAMQPSAEQRLWMYETMWVIRNFEDTLALAYFEGKLPPKIQPKLAFDLGAGPIPGEMHLAAGQEAAAVGACAHLKREDSVWGTHRAHHFAIAKGVDLDRMAAEIFGKVTGLGRGKGGHMHLFDPDAHFACTGIVGAGIPQAVGAALAYKKLGNGAVALSEFGEGASNQGSFHEALNMAGLWKLPCVFVCQDNNYGISVNKAASTVGRVDRHARRGLRHAGRARGRERRGPGVRGGGRGRRTRARRTRSDAGRGQGRSALRPFPGRPGDLSPEGRSGVAEEEGCAEGVRGAAQGRGRARRCGGSRSCAIARRRVSTRRSHSRGRATIRRPTRPSGTCSSRRRRPSRRIAGAVQ